MHHVGIAYSNVKPFTKILHDLVVEMWYMDYKDELL